MKNKKYDISGIGSPLLDFTVMVDEKILDDMGLKKGQMHLVDEEKSSAILKRLENLKMETSPGGSSANTLAGVATLGGTGILMGTVGKDSYADYYKNETEKSGIKTRLGRHKGVTGHAITLITPDYERTFATHLGAALQFRKADVNTGDIKKSRILHIEGYLLEMPKIREAAIFAMETAKNNGIIVSVDLADPGLISRIHGVLKEIVRKYTNIVFVNEDEAKAFTGSEGEAALDILYSMCGTAVVKLGPRGSLIKRDGAVHRIPIYDIPVVNRNGAGDMYAAGVLYGIARGIDIEMAGKIGSYASSLVVGQTGARLKGKIDVGKIEL